MIRFFRLTAPPGPFTDVLGPFRILTIFHGDIRILLRLPGVDLQFMSSLYITLVTAFQATILQKKVLNIVTVITFLLHKFDVGKIFIAHIFLINSP